MFSKNKRGFALVELLIVIFIIALLAALILAVTSSARARGRDGRRKADMDSIRKALELYRADNNGNVTLGCGSPPCLSSAGAGWISGLAPTYIASVPRDPTNSDSEIYRYQRGTIINDYELDGVFEDASNDSLEMNDNGNCATRYEIGTLLTIMTTCP